MIILALTACTGSGEPTATDTGPHTTPTATTGDTGTDRTWPYQLQCDTLPPLPASFTSLPSIEAAEDFSFDLLGNVVSVDLSGNLVTQAIDGSPELVAPNLGATRGARVLPDGSVAIASVDLATIERISPDGQRVTLASVPQPNGIAVDLHDSIWVATSVGLVARVFLDGTVQNVVDLNGISLDGIAFSPDYRRLYFNSEFGDVGVIDIDENGGPVAGEPTLFATIPVNPNAILDGMTTDQCGNLYVVRMDGKVYRFLPDGSAAGVIEFGAGIVEPGLYMPAVNFGSGFGGFERDHLYAISFNGGFTVADVGIEGRWEPYYPMPDVP